MKISKYKLAIIAIVCILFVIIYKTAGYIMHYSKGLPKISVVLGDTIDSVEQHSTYPFKEEMVEISIGMQTFALTETPMILEYRDERHGFTLPPTIFLSVDFVQNKANYIRMSPQLALLNLADVTQLAKDLTHKFNQAGWQIDKEPNYTTPDKFAKIFTTRQETGKSTVHVWTLDDKEMVLRIMRNITKEDLLEINPYDQTAEDQFLLDLEIYFKSS